MEHLLYWVGQRSRMWHRAANIDLTWENYFLLDTSLPPIVLYLVYFAAFSSLTPVSRGKQPSLRVKGIKIHRTSVRHREALWNRCSEPWVCTNAWLSVARQEVTSITVGWTAMWQQTPTKRNARGSPNELSVRGAAFVGLLELNRELNCFMGQSVG